MTVVIMNYTQQTVNVTTYFITLKYCDMMFIENSNTKSYTTIIIILLSLTIFIKHRYYFDISELGSGVH